MDVKTYAYTQNMSSMVSGRERFWSFYYTWSFEKVFQVPILRTENPVQMCWNSHKVKLNIERLSIYFGDIIPSKNGATLLGYTINVSYLFAVAMV